MKLKIGENIRRLRRSSAMTQEEFAAHMGVSGQAVSRWETGATYPDIEMLPVIAELFGVGVEELMGLTSTARTDAATVELRRIMETMNPEEARIALRQLHRVYPRNTEIMEILCRYSDRPEEVRHLLDGMLAQGLTLTECHDPIQQLFYDEEESGLPFLMERYTTPIDESGEFFLEERYRYRGEYDKLEARREETLLVLYSRLCRYLVWDVMPDHHVKNHLWASRRILELINSLAGTAGLRPVSGDGVPDLWFGERVTAGLRLTAHAASSGQTDEAFCALEDTIDLCEHVWHLPDNTKLTFRTPSLCRFEGILRRDRSQSPTEYRLTINLNPGPIELFRSPRSVIACLTAPRGWEWFDPIRAHPRFLACLARMKAFDRPVIHPANPLSS